MPEGSNKTLFNLNMTEISTSISGNTSPFPLNMEVQVNSGKVTFLLGKEVGAGNGLSLLVARRVWETQRVTLAPFQVTSHEKQTL